MITVITVEIRKKGQFYSRSFNELAEMLMKNLFDDAPTDIHCSYPRI